jgi:hypothetical protein
MAVRPTRAVAAQDEGDDVPDDGPDEIVKQYTREYNEQQTAQAEAREVLRKSLEVPDYSGDITKAAEESVKRPIREAIEAAEEHMRKRD